FTECNVGRNCLRTSFSNRKPVWFGRSIAFDWRNSSNAERMREQETLSETQTAVLYFTEQPGDLLFYEETFFQEESAFHSDSYFWTKIKTRFDRFSFEAFAGDRFIRRLRSIRSIKILLGQPIDPQVVRTKLKVMLRDRKYHHLRWLVVDSLLLPLSLLI